MLSKPDKALLWIIGAILMVRFIPMAMVPLTDTTEARYGEIARLMLETGDWVTPYFDYGVPFWGKPPFAFWMQALSFKLLGVNEFAPRFPSWLATVFTAGLIYRLTKTVFDRHAAVLAIVIFLSCLLVFVLSGAVLTDPFLALAVTLSLVSLVMVGHEKTGIWRYGIFLGVALGLLSKGPIALVLIFGPIGIWLVLAKHRWRMLMRLPWFGGLILVVALTLPWYVSAELKTPGFIEYFLVGEHFYRFIDPGWGGDLYGSAHNEPKGSIWVLWIAASFPWGPVALAVLFMKLFARKSRLIMRNKLIEDDTALLFLWAIFPMCFFSFAGNILWTYVLPALPALAILLALYFSHVKTGIPSSFFSLLVTSALSIPVLVLVGTLYASWYPDILPTEKQLVRYFESVKSEEDVLYFVEHRSFSARYYSSENAKLLTVDNLEYQVELSADKPLYLAIPKNNTRAILQHISKCTVVLFESKKYELLKTQQNCT